MHNDPFFAAEKHCQCCWYVANVERSDKGEELLPPRVDGNGGLPCSQSYECLELKRLSKVGGPSGGPISTYKQRLSKAAAAGDFSMRTLEFILDPNRNEKVRGSGRAHLTEQDKAARAATKQQRKRHGEELLQKRKEAEEAGSSEKKKISQPGQKKSRTQYTFNQPAARA